MYSTYWADFTSFLSLTVAHLSDFAWSLVSCFCLFICLFYCGMAQSVLSCHTAADLGGFMSSRCFIALHWGGSMSFRHAIATNRNGSAFFQVSH